MTISSTDLAVGLLAERSANEWLREAGTRAAPRMLFGEFWLEGELAIMFGEAGSGKSLLAMQIAEALARGRGIEPIGQQTQGQDVLYFDLCLDAKQFEMRYSREGKRAGRRGQPYRFSDRLRRIEVDLSADVPEGYSGIDEYLAAAIEAKVRETGARVLIFDNINRLKRTCESIREALPLMRALKRMKRLYGLSILVLAQTSRRATTRNLDITDLPGGKLLSNFADNIFAIGESRMYSAARYLKQVGPTSTERIFGSENVPTFGLEKIGGEFLGFKFWWFAREREHLVPGTDRGRWETLSRVRTMAEQGMSVREIAVQLGRSKSAVHRLLRIVGCAEVGKRNAELGKVSEVETSSIGVEDSSEEPPEGGTQNEDERLRESYLAQRGAVGPPAVLGDTEVVVENCDAADQAVSVSGASGDVFPPGSPPLTHMVTPLGRDVWVESFDTLGRPEVWYRYDRQGRKFKHTRGTLAIVVEEVKENAAAPST